MKKTESLFIIGLLIVAIGGALTVGYKKTSARTHANHQQPTTRFGAFLAARHAIYVNDFDSAARFSAVLANEVAAPVQETKMLAEFLSGRLPESAALLGGEKAAASQFVYDAYLITNDKWDELYKRRKSEESAYTAPLRIWAAVATGNVNDALKFIDKLKTNESWKSFVRGQIYAQTEKVEQAAAEFAKVTPDFMNINDYMHIMSFYRHNGMEDAAQNLHAEFTMRPGGMFMSEYDEIPDWQSYSGFKNALAFGLVQSVSHTTVMMYSDLSILLLRFAQIIAPQFDAVRDSVNYYMGQYFYNTRGNSMPFFASVSGTSPYHLFAIMRISETTGNYRGLARAHRKNPLFVPATNKLIGYNVSHGNRRAALRTVNRALRDGRLGEIGRAFFMKSRAHINFTFGKYDLAQSDLKQAANALGNDAEILSLQAKIWAAQNREIESAYEYAMTLIRQNPADILGWDTLGRVVAVREGDDAALDILERVAEVTSTNSALFENLGDVYTRMGDKRRARDAYMRALDLAEDGLVVIPKVQKKLRKVK